MFYVLCFCVNLLLALSMLLYHELFALCIWLLSVIVGCFILYYYVGLLVAFDNVVFMLFVCFCFGMCALYVFGLFIFGMFRACLLFLLDVWILYLLIRFVAVLVDVFFFKYREVFVLCALCLLMCLLLLLGGFVFVNVV